MRNGGREKGTTNKVSTQIKSILSNHLDAYLSEQFLTDWHQLNARERVRIASTLVKLIVPQPPREQTEESTDTPTEGFNITIVSAKEEIERLEQLRVIDCA
jgi:hypothetical protein